MPKLRTETYGSGDFSWLGSDHGMWNGRTETLDISAFTPATHYPDGYIPSGTPVAKVGDVLVPYDDAELTTTDAGVLAGFVLTDQQVVAGTGDFAVPVVDHGRVKAANVPGGFVPPVAPEKTANTTIVFI